LFGTGWNDVPKQRSTRSAPAKRKPSRKRTASVSSGQDVDGNLSIEENITKYAEQARRLVLAEWHGIVQGLIKKAKSGGYQQTKLLLDLCDLSNMDASQLNEQRREQLCDVLLKGLKLSSAQPEDETAEVERRQETETID
jgi:hypothetical protein